MDVLQLRRLWSLDGRKMALWSEPSRRRLRRETQAISQVLVPHIPRSCTHVRGHGGVKGALRQIQRRMPKARFVARFDIAAYYTSMRHDVIKAFRRGAWASQNGRLLMFSQDLGYQPAQSL